MPPLELMRINGWDHSFCADGLSPFSDDVSPELLSDVAGNMWNGWSYMAVDIAAVGCCNWSRAAILTAEVREEKKKQLEQISRHLMTRTAAVRLTPEVMWCRSAR